MLQPGCRFDFVFPCVDSTGAPLAPTGTPTGTLYQNGTALGTTVTCTVSGAKVFATCTIPTTSVATGDRFQLIGSVVIAGVTYDWLSEADTVEWAQVLTSAYDAAKGAMQAGAVTLAGDFTSTMKASLNAATPNLNSAYDAAKSAASATALALVQSDTTALAARLTTARAGYLDNLNVSGHVAAQADIDALNQSASRRLLLTTVGHYERKDSGSATYTIESRLFDGDGAVINGDSTPTLTVTGSISGSMAANLGTATNPATGVYRWLYTVTSAATHEELRIDVAATMSGSTFTLSTYSVVTDDVVASFSSTDRTMLTGMYNKLPSRGFLAGATAATGAIVPSDVGLAAANLDTQFSTLTTSVNAIPAAVPSLATIAGAILVTPANKLGTNSSGQVQSSNLPSVPTAADISTAVWSSTTRTLSGFGSLVADIATAIWTATTRTLSAFGFTVTPSNAADVTAIKARTDLIPSSPAATGDAMMLATAEHAAIAAALLVDPTHKLATDADGHVTATNGGGGGGNVSTFVMPLRSTSTERVLPNRIDLFVRERIPLAITIYDDQKQPVDCTGLTCTLFAEGGTQIANLVPHPAVPGQPPSRYTFTPPESLAAVAGSQQFSLRVQDTSHRVLACGFLVIGDLP